jgi:hypothetical protein
MAAAFECDLRVLEAEVAELIMADQLPARIDSKNKTLHRRQVDKRDAGYQKVRPLDRWKGREAIPFVAVTPWPCHPTR